MDFYEIHIKDDYEIVCRLLTVNGMKEAHFKEHKAEEKERRVEKKKKGR